MPRPDVRDERIPQILDAAAGIFAKHGIDGSSMNQVAANCGLSKATIYHYFQSKTEMVNALVDRLFMADVEGTERLKSSSEPATERLQAYAEGLSELLARHYEVLPIVAEFKALAGRDDSVRETLVNYFQPYLEAFELVLEQGLAAGELREDLDCGQAAVALVALIEGSILLANSMGRDLRLTLTGNVTAFLRSLAS
jgi:TetR/AcrR family transcriptional regulator